MGENHAMCLGNRHNTDWPQGLIFGIEFDRLISKEKHVPLCKTWRRLSKKGDTCQSSKIECGYINMGRGRERGHVLFTEMGSCQSKVKMRKLREIDEKEMEGIQVQ